MLIMNIFSSIVICLQATCFKICQMMFGIVFQECYQPNSIRNTNHLKLLRMLWVFMSMLLTMAFVGNLKTSLVVNNYYDETKNFDQIFEKDLPFHVSRAFYDFVNASATLNSTLNTRILCQVNKKKSKIFSTE